MPVDYPAIGASLRAARERRGWTQAQVARRLGMTPQNVSYMEKGSIAAPPENIEKYAAAVGMRFAVLLAGQDEPRSMLAARIVDILPTVDPAVVEMLEEWVGMWERKRESARSA